MLNKFRLLTIRSCKRCNRFCRKKFFKNDRQVGSVQYGDTPENDEDSIIQLIGTKKKSSLIKGELPVILEVSDLHEQSHRSVIKDNMAIHNISSSSSGSYDSEDSENDSGDEDGSDSNGS